MPLLVLCCAAAAACGDSAPLREWTPADHGQPAGPDPDREPREPDPEQSPQETVARAAAALWNASCASCHGRDGRGQGEARPPGAQIPDFTAAEWQASRTDAQLEQVIRDGRGMMPGFGKQVNAHGLAALIAHVRGYGKAQAAGRAEPAPR